jgi:hypothetical protein
MPELTRTAIFVAAAVVAVAAAVLARPRDYSASEIESVGKPLFPAFADPAAAASLEVIHFNETLASIRRFRVAKIDGVWVIPSHQNYPADATEHLRDAATSLIGLTAIAVASDVLADHELLGVIEPNKDKTQVGDKGVGTLIVMQDAKGNDLARLIVGKPVKGKSDQRFVRKPSENRVYAAVIDPEKLSTKFEDWIERDLLRVSGADIDEVVINNYSVSREQGTGGRILVSREDQLSAAFKWNQAEFKWNLADLKLARNGQLAPAELAPNEEINSGKLDELKRALDDLKIVGVERKPAGLGADLRASADFQVNLESSQSLITRGFYPLRLPSGQYELLSGNGDVVVRTKEGVEYLLRFGEIAGISEGEDAGKLQRYLFVAARVDESRFKPSTYDVEDFRKLEEDGLRKEPPDQARKKAEDKVQELNFRFADWYYIIPDEVFKKVHLDRADLIQAKAGEPAAGEAGDAP